MRYRIIVEKTFEKGLRSLPPDRAKGAARSLSLFQDTPELNRFEFRPLKGLPRYYIINARGGDRIILRKDADDLFAAVDVGPHDNIYRRWNR